MNSRMQLLLNYSSNKELSKNMTSWKRERDAYFAIITHGNTLPDMKMCSHRCNPIYLALLLLDHSRPFSLCSIRFALRCSRLSMFIHHMLQSELLNFEFFFNISSACSLTQRIKWKRHSIRLLQQCVTQTHLWSVSRGPWHRSHVKNNGGVKFSEFQSLSVTYPWFNIINIATAPEASSFIHSFKSMSTESEHLRQILRSFLSSSDLSSAAMECVHQHVSIVCDFWHTHETRATAAAATAKNNKTNRERQQQKPAKLQTNYRPE